MIALAVLMGAESFASRNPPPPEIGLHKEHPVRFWTLNPGWHWDPQSQEQVYVNSLGLCAEEPEAVPPHLTVLLLGDSCIYGSGVKVAARLDRALEKRLRAVTGRSVRVYNGGCSGYSSYQGLDLLRSVGWRIRPDVVVLAYLHGDANLDVVPDKERLGTPFVGAVRSLMWQSPLYRWLRWRLRPDTNYAHFARRDKEPNGVQRVSVDDYASNLRALAALARAQGARHVVFLSLPLPIDLGPYDRKPGTQPFTLSTVGAQEGVMIPGRELWTNRKDRRRLFWDNIHFNAEGCKVFADDLTDALLQKGLIEAAAAPRQTPGAPP